MANLDLSKYGIVDAKEIVHNPSYEILFEDEMKPDLEGFEKAQLTELDTVNVMTGIFTGRSPKDKFIVKDDVTKDTMWWTSETAKKDKKSTSPDVWSVL
jgi:phosphoenolpyruvate carboxykinase (ATP)